MPGGGFRALLGREGAEPLTRSVWGSPPCPNSPPQAVLWCSGLAGQLADPLAEVEGKLEHGGRQALVDEVPGQATLRGKEKEQHVRENSSSTGKTAPPGR